MEEWDGEAECLFGALRKKHWADHFLAETVLNVGVSKNRGTPKWMVKIMDNPIKNGMIWGENPLFFGNIHVEFG